MISTRAVFVLAGVFCAAGCAAFVLGNAAHVRLEAGSALAVIASTTNSTTTPAEQADTTSVGTEWTIATVRGIKTEIGTCGSGMVKLSWNEPSGASIAWSSAGTAAFSYVLMRNQVDIYSGTERRVIDTGLAPGASYTYMLVAMQNGTQLAPVTVTVDAPDACPTRDTETRNATTTASTTGTTSSDGTFSTTTANTDLPRTITWQATSTPRIDAATSAPRTAVPEAPAPVPPSVVRDLPRATTSEPLPTPPEVAAKAEVLVSTISSLAAAHDGEAAPHETAEADVALLYTDSNKDGISDYDAVHVFNMDPKAAAPTTVVGKKVYTPEEKVLAGYDPTKKELVRIFPEEPSRSSLPPTDAYTVDSVALATTSAASELRFSGKALPNSFITVYIFSTPVVVTVKTDSNGTWTYTLDRELEDGLHTVVTATVDTSGRILAKSQPFPFTKTAQAASLEAMPLPAEATKPTLLSGMNFYIVFGLSTLIFFLALIYVGVDARRRQALAAEALDIASSADAPVAPPVPKESPAPPPGRA